MNHNKNQTLGRLLLCGAVEIICLAAQANAATFSWDPKISGGTDLGGTGPWATGNVWWNGTSNMTWADTNDVVFGGSTAGTVTLGGARTAGDVKFTTGGYTLVFGGSTLTLSSFTNTSPVPVTFIGSSTVASTVGIGTDAANVTLPGVTIADAGGFANGLGKSGTGRLSISSSNWASTGIMTVAEGQLRLTSAFSPRVRLNPGATTTTKTSVLELAGGDFSGSFGGASGGVQITAAAADRHAGFAAIGGDRTVTMTNAVDVVWRNSGNQNNQMQLQGELILATAASTGKLTLTHTNAGSGNGLRLAFNTEIAGTYMRPIRVENGSAAIDAEIAMTLKDSTVADRIGAINKVGDGVLALTYANTYSGGTTVSTGTLLVNNTTGSGTGSGAVTVASGATLGGTGTVGGSVSVSGILAPGNSAGNLTLNNGLTLSGIFSWELAALSTSNPGTDFDMITVTSGTVDITGASLGLNLGSNAPSAVPFWQTTQTWTGILNNTGAGTLTGNFAAIDNSPWSSRGSFSNTYTGNDVNLVWTPVPEPRAALLGGIGLLALFRRRRATAGR